MENQNHDEVTALAKTTLQRIDALMEELDAFHTFYKQKREAATRLERREMPDPIPGFHDFVVEIKGTKNSVQRVLNSRTKSDTTSAAAADEEKDRRDRVVLMGCGLAPHQEQWNAIKRMQGLLSFRRRFSGRGKRSRLGPTVDAVVQNGFEWLKVMNLTEKKLLYQMAQEGWHPDDSSEEDGDSDVSDDGENTGIVILKTMRQLVAAARTNRCNTRIPGIRVVLPNLPSGRVEAIDKVLDRVRNLGISKRGEGDVDIVVDCADSAFFQTPVPPLEQACTNLFRDTNVDRLTSTVNLELTMILSLVSDIAHAKVEAKEWYSRQTVSHLEDERHSPGTRLQGVYAALQGKRLECTQEVAREVRNVVDDLGTETTKMRTLIWFGRQSMLDGFLTPRAVQHPNGDGKAAEEAERARLVSRLRELSKYPVPDGLQLPIQIVGDDEFNHENYTALIEAEKLPPVAAKVWAKLDRSYNRSCYLWGWLQDITTVSANNLNTRLIDVTVDKVCISPWPVTLSQTPKADMTYHAPPLFRNARTR